jgi:putative ABC transport system permease protein
VKYLTYILRNARRNPIRSLLTIASMAVSLFLVMVLLSFFSINDEVLKSSKIHNRILTLNSQGFSGMVPIAYAHEIAAVDGIVGISPFSWFGGKFGEEVQPFAQFGIDPEGFFKVYEEFELPPDQLKAFRDDRSGCVVGRKLAEDRNFKIGDPLPLKADLYPFDLKLTIRGIYDGPKDRNRRMCLFQWDYFDEQMKRSTQGAMSGNAGCFAIRCKSADAMASICRKIDTLFLNSDNPTRTQTEEQFSKMFMEMMGDLKGVMRLIGAAVVVSLIFVAGNAMAMALRERTTEVAVLKAIGFGKTLILSLVLAEAMLVSGLGGFIGTIGCKLFCDVVDVSQFMGGLLPFFYIPWSTALLGLGFSLLVGFSSGVIPALLAARLSVVQGLRKVV